jgi:hypothetical protein
MKPGLTSSTEKNPGSLHIEGTKPAPQYFSLGLSDIGPFIAD